MKKSILCIILILTTLFTTGCFGINQNSLEHVFADWVAEEDSSVAMHAPDVYGEHVVLIDDQFVDIGEVLVNNNIAYPHFLLLDGDLLYFYNERFLSEKSQEEFETSCLYMGEIYTYNINTNEIDKVFSGYYNDENLKDDYSPVVSYCDRNIYLTDGINVTVINIDSCITEQNEYAAFTIPNANKYSVKVDENGWLKDRKKLEITAENFERTITFDYMAQRHEYIKEIEGLESTTMLFGKNDRFEEFFAGFDVINDIVYIKCTVFDNDGESNYLLFSYDPVTDEFKFLHHMFVSDSATFYVFPRE